MNIRLASLCALCAIGFALAACSGAEQRNTVSDTVEKVTFEVTGMTCTGCEETIKTAIAEEDGIHDNEVSFENGTAIVSFDPKETDIDDIRERIASAGYEAKQMN